MLSITKSSTIDQTQLVGYKLHKLASMLDRQADTLLLKQFELTLSQFVLLFGLAHHPEASQSALARYLNLTQAAVSRQIDGLLNRGLIERHNNVKNRREHIIKVTPKGHELLTKAKLGLGAMYQTVLKDVSSSQLKTFSKVLDKLLVCSRDPNESGGKDK